MHLLLNLDGRQRSYDEKRDDAFQREIDKESGGKRRFVLLLNLPTERLQVVVLWLCTVAAKVRSLTLLFSGDAFSECSSLLPRQTVHLSLIRATGTSSNLMPVTETQRFRRKQSFPWFDDVHSHLRLNIECIEGGSYQSKRCAAQKCFNQI